MSHEHGDPGHRADQAVARVERYSLATGTSFTPLRRRVLAALLDARGPLSAYDLAERLSTPRRVAPVQIYRALEFLGGAGVVHRLATRSAFVACDHEHERGETTVFLVCEDCGTVAEVSSAAVGRGLRGAAAESGFEPMRPMIEVEGRCAACRAAA